MSVSVPRVLAEDSLHSAWSLVIPKGMFSGGKEERKITMLQEFQQNTSKHHECFFLYLQVGNADYGFLFLFCFPTLMAGEKWMRLVVFNRSKKLLKCLQG